MDYSDEERIPADLKAVAARLRQQRTVATPVELDRMKLRAIQQADRPRASLYSRQKGKLMKSRLALTAVIATGILMCTGGATMAISGSSGGGNASEAQYEQPGQAGGTLNGEPGNVAPASEQVAVAKADTGTLPFTGFAAIPVLVLGVGFLTVGLVLRSRSRTET